jgi:transposase
MGMRDNDGRKLDHKTLEQVRIRVVQQVERGARPEYLASVLGFARSTVFGWMARYREGGLDVLKARTIPGRPQKLSGPQLIQIHQERVGVTRQQSKSPRSHPNHKRGQPFSPEVGLTDRS